MRMMRIVGRSMEPTLRPGQVVLINTRAYRQRRPQRDEVVVAQPAALGGKTLVKRIAGLPHETVTREGRRWQLREHQFFLVGDHPTDSLDSRRFGPVTHEELVAAVWARLWPWKRFSRGGEDGESSEVP